MGHSRIHRHLHFRCGDQAGEHMLHLRGYRADLEVGPRRDGGCFRSSEPQEKKL